MGKTKKKIAKKGKKTQEAIMKTEVRNLMSKNYFELQPLHVNENYSSKFNFR